MTEALTILLRIAGAGLILLAVVHLPISRHLRWREDAARLSPTNAAIFHVHAFFICVVLVIMGLPALLDPGIFLDQTPAGAWLAWSWAGFWALRLYCQWFIYPAALWRGKLFETRIHWLFTAIWLGFAVLFTACGLRQEGWL